MTREDLLELCELAKEPVEVPVAAPRRRRKAAPDSVDALMEEIGLLNARVRSPIVWIQGRGYLDRLRLQRALQALRSPSVDWEGREDTETALECYAGPKLAGSVVLRQDRAELRLLVFESPDRCAAYRAASDRRKAEIMARLNAWNLAGNREK